MFMLADIFAKLRQSFLISFWRRFIPDKMVNNFYHLPLAILAVLYYRYPARKLTIIGVTGTDGKTTTATLIYEIFKKAGFKTALISTVSAKIGDLDLSTGLHVTSPNPWELQRLLRLIVNKGFKYVVLETTSHGLSQHRLWGCNFYAGVITNITHEHLDYHKTWENYLRAKAKLFKSAKYSILNKDDSSFIKLKKLARGKIITYSLKQADYTPKNFPFKTKLLGDFNLLNCLAAISVAKILKVKDKVIRIALVSFKGIVGRMEEIKTGQDFKVYIDFAHTPNALENSLKTLKNLPHNRLIAVFGCAGLRDVKKRPMMGKIACHLADMVVLTAEDPRTEDVNQIINQITSGCKEKKKIYQESDRQRAINLAIIDLAQKKDIVAVFGKGHEQSMCLGKKEYPWSDNKAVKKALKRKLGEV